MDFCNHDYGVVTLVNGVGELHEQDDEHDTSVYRLVKVVYGDLEANGAEGAVVMLHSDSNDPSAGPSNGADLFAFALRDGEVVSMGSAPAARVAGFTLVIDSGEVKMHYQRQDELCQERWRPRLGKLVYLDYGCGL